MISKEKPKPKWLKWLRQDQCNVWRMELRHAKHLKRHRNLFQAKIDAFIDEAHFV